MGFTESHERFHFFHFKHADAEFNSKQVELV